MMDLKLLTHNATPAEKAAYADFMRELFGIRLEGWMRRTQWTEDYTCYTIWDEGVLAANVSTYAMRMRIGDIEQRWVQLGGVATRPGWRNRGLSRAVMERVLMDYGDVPMFLFANRSVLDYYPRFGFHPAQDRIQRLQVQLESHPGRMIALSADSPEVERYLQDRCCFSATLDCLNAAPINWFHLLAGDCGRLYHVPDAGLLLAAERTGKQLLLHEVWTRQVVPLHNLLNMLDFPGIRETMFGFNPDWLGIEAECVPYTSPDGSVLFFRGNIDLPLNAMIPWLART